jgi:hypothetical protein
MTPPRSCPPRGPWSPAWPRPFGPRLTLATAESCTVGLIDHLLTTSRVLAMVLAGCGLCRRGQDRLLGVSPKVLSARGSVSRKPSWPWPGGAKGLRGRQRRGRFGDRRPTGERRRSPGHGVDGLRQPGGGHCQTFRFTGVRRRSRPRPRPRPGQTPGPLTPRGVIPSSNASPRRTAATRLETASTLADRSLGWTACDRGSHQPDGGVGKTPRPQSRCRLSRTRPDGLAVDADPQAIDGAMGATVRPDLGGVFWGNVRPGRLSGPARGRICCRLHGPGRLESRRPRPPGVRNAVLGPGGAFRVRPGDHRLVRPTLAF